MQFLSLMMKSIGLFRYICAGTLLALTLVTFAAHGEEAPKDPFSSLTYGDLRPRLLVRSTTAAIGTLSIDPAYLNAEAAGYTPALSFTKPQPPVSDGQLFRVLYMSETDDFKYTMGATDAKTTGLKIYSFTLIPVGEDLRPNGSSFELATKASPGANVAELVGKKIDLAANLQSLMYREARLNDVLLNVIDVKTDQGTIKANSRGRIVKIEKRAQSWSFAKDYDLTLRVSPCPAELRPSNCEAVIHSIGYMRDPTWGHWVNPANRRSLSIFGHQITYN